MWRSEIEAVLDAVNHAAKYVQARQQARDRCRCPRRSRQEVATVFSDTDIFSSRENMVDLVTSDTWPQAGEQNNITAVFSSLDAHMGAVWHIGPSETRYFALIASSDSRCPYIIRSGVAPPDLATMARILKRTFEDCDVYNTAIGSGSMSFFTDSWYRQIWNIKYSYGVFFSRGARSFMAWLQYLRMPIPTVQGSPRSPIAQPVSSLNGSTVPGIFDDRPDEKERKKLLRRLFREEARAWTIIARRCRKQGVDCCALFGGNLPPSRLKARPSIEE
ncbi:hypothetical protein BJX62DRAFT_235473 [Aspergillus germanicus]